MPAHNKKPTTPPPGRNSKTEPASNQPAASAAAALSFLKDTKGVVSWSVRDLAETLKISRNEADTIVGLLEAQGYVAPEGKSEWITTAAGESVAGAKLPRLSRDIVETALVGLKSRITEINKDRSAPFRIDAAVAFGDFLLPDRAKVQAADVGIRLVSREPATEQRSATTAKREQAFLKQLRGKTQARALRSYAAWMSRRTHRTVL